MLINTETHMDWFIPGSCSLVKRSPVAVALSNYVGHKVLSGLTVDTVGVCQRITGKTYFNVYTTLRTNRLHQVVRQCEGDLC